MNRRTFLKASLAATLLPAARAAAQHRPYRILLCNGWQIENIGDVAHTPAILAGDLCTGALRSRWAS